MAISQSGANIGCFSGGCVEAAVIAEAMDVLETGRARLIRFGAGSRYIDIRLPCAGGIDLLFTPDPDSDIVSAIVCGLAERMPTSIALDARGGIRLGDGHVDGWQGESFLPSCPGPVIADYRAWRRGSGAGASCLIRLQSECSVLIALSTISPIQWEHLKKLYAHRNQPMR